MGDPDAAAVTKELRLVLVCTGVRDIGVALVGGVLGGGGGPVGVKEGPERGGGGGGGGSGVWSDPGGGGGLVTSIGGGGGGGGKMLVLPELPELGIIVTAARSEAICR